MFTFRDYHAAVAASKTYHIVLNLTDKCNLNCTYCFAKKRNKTMSMATLKQSIRFAIIEATKHTKEPKNILVTFFGGEPLLAYSKIQKIIKWCDKKGFIEKFKMRFDMTTNGTLLTKKRLKWLSDHKVDLLLSLDGCRDTQDDQRPCKNGASSFDLILTNLKDILRFYPNITMRSTITPRNVNNLYIDYLWAGYSGIKNYCAVPNVYEFWTPEALRDLSKQYYYIAREMKWNITHNRVPLKNLDFVKEWISMAHPQDKSEKDPSRCGLGICSVGITVDGLVTTCQEHNTYGRDDSFIIGDIFNGIDIIKHYNLIASFMSRDNVSANPNQCKSCLIKDSCNSRSCLSANYARSGELFMRNPLSCVIDQIKYRVCREIMEEANKRNEVKFAEFILREALAYKEG